MRRQIKRHAGNSNSGSNNQQPTPEKPSQPSQTCDGIHPNALGNTGMVFNSKEEAESYGERLCDENLMISELIKQ